MSVRVAHKVAAVLFKAYRSVFAESERQLELEVYHFIQLVVSLITEAVMGNPALLPQQFNLSHLIQDP